jgi:type III secretion protein N (ATPase)
LIAEVVGFSQQAITLTPIADIRGVSSTTEVIPTGTVHKVPSDGDQKWPLEIMNFYLVDGRPSNSMLRNSIDKPLTLGIRPLDTFLAEYFRDTQKRISLVMDSVICFALA